MATWLRQSTSVDIGLGPFLDSTDGVTPETGLTISQADVRLKKNGGNWAQKNQASSATHEENGWYEVNLDTTDTNTLGILLLAVNESGALPVWSEFLVVTANIYDSYFSTDLLQVDVTQIAGATVATGSAQLGVNVVSYASGQAPLQPTTAGRTLDVSATGEAGVDWANVGSPTTTVGLTNTTISTSQQVASVSGAVGSVTGAVGSVATGGITAASIATDAITAAKIANGAIDAATFATGAIDSSALAAGAITNAKFASNAISASVFAANAIDSNAVAASAVTELVNGVWDETLTTGSHNGANSAGRFLRQTNGDIIIDGTAVSGTINTITLDSSASATNGTYDPALIRITAGTGAGQSRLIMQYTGATKVAVVDRDWRTIPNATSTYEILSFANLVSLNEGFLTGATANTAVLNADASSIDDVYIGQNLIIRTGSGQDQTRMILDYDGATKTVTIGPPWVVTPNTTSGYMVLPFGRSSVVVMADDVITASVLAASAVTEIQTGLSTLDAAGVRSAVGLAAANLDTQLDALPTATEAADALLKRDLTAVTGEASRSVLNAIRFLRNKWSVAANTLTVTKEDDATPAWTATVTTDASADPIIGSDPT